MQKSSLLLAFLALLMHWSCSEREFSHSPDSKLNFSTDTLSFDTVFSTIGSTTRYFMVYNRNDKFLKISDLHLAGGDNSYFRLNVDGRMGNNVQNTNIAPNDSMYVFVEVTVDPQDSNNPVMLIDSVVFETNGNEQAVKLLAYGQDVHLIDGEVLESQIWPNDKPYLIRNSAMVDTLNTLSIEAGAKIHFTHNSALFVKGSLIVNGTQSDSVVFTSVRTEQLYDDVPGLWQGIWLLPGSVDNELTYSVVKNAVVGIRADSTMNKSKPTLRLHNTRVEHHTVAGLFAQGSSVLATNSIFADCGIYALSLQVGGDYEFYHCTVANYWGYSSRSTPSVLVRNYYVDVDNQVQLRPINKAFFYNCIVYGNTESELVLDAHTDASFNFLFSNCLLKVSSSLDFSVFPQFSGCVANEHPYFADIQAYDYRLQEKSPAKDLGKLSSLSDYPQWLNNDMKAMDRTSDGLPDAGAFEYEPLPENR